MNLQNDGIGHDDIATIVAAGASPRINISGIIESGSNLSMATNAEYNGDIISEGASAAKNIIAAKTGLSGLVNAAGNSVKNVVSTRKGYLGGDGGDFSITILFFLGIKECGNLSDYKPVIDSLSKLTLPKIGVSGIMQSNIYHMQNRLTSKLIQVSLGSWFAADGLFCKSGSFDFSPHKDMNGKPLFMRWTGSFEYKEAPTAEIISGWYL